MIDPAYLVAGGGLLVAVTGGIVAFRKSGPESSQIMVNAAKDVVLIQKDAIDSLTKGLAEAHRKITELQTLEAQVAEMREELVAVRNENKTLRSENTKLRRRISHLEETNGS